MPRAIRAEIKLKVLERVIGGESVTAIAKDCRLSTGCIHNWVRQNARKIKKARKILQIDKIADAVFANAPPPAPQNTWDAPQAGARALLEQRQRDVAEMEQAIGHLKALRTLLPGGKPCDLGHSTM